MWHADLVAQDVALDRLKGFMIALGVQHRNAAFRSQRLCSLYPRKSSASNPYRAGEVPVRIRQSGSGYRHASFGNLVTCGNVWVCPRCAEAKSLARRRQLNRAADAWLAESLPLYLLTLTIPHTSDDSLQSLLDAKKAAWTSVNGSRAFRKARELGQLAGYAAVLQVKYRRPGARTSGWHVHMHVLLFMDEGVDAEMMSEFEQRVRASWASALTRTGVTAELSDAYGTDLRRIAVNAGIGHYLTTIENLDPDSMLEDLGSIGIERPDPLSSHDQGSLLPMDLFGEFMASRTKWIAGDAGRGRAGKDVFFDLPKGGEVIFDGERYLTVDKQGTTTSIPLQKKHRPWFEFQLGIRRMRKTTFSAASPESDELPAKLWSELRIIDKEFDDEAKNTDYEFGTGRDVFIIDRQSWVKHLAHDDQNRWQILGAAGKGQEQFEKVARRIGVTYRKVENVS